MKVIRILGKFYFSILRAFCAPLHLQVSCKCNSKVFFLYGTHKIHRWKFLPYLSVQIIRFITGRGSVKLTNLLCKGQTFIQFLPKRGIVCEIYPRSCFPLNAKAKSVLREWFFHRNWKKSTHATFNAGCRLR